VAKYIVLCSQTNGGLAPDLGDNDLRFRIGIWSTVLLSITGIETTAGMKAPQAFRVVHSRSSAENAKWFRCGLDSGQVRSCNTFK
jgi:hypothetical protein